MQVLNKMKNFWNKIKKFFSCFSGVKVDNEPSAVITSEIPEPPTIYHWDSPPHSWRWEYGKVLSIDEIDFC